MEPSDLQPLTVYNEHAEGAREHRHPRRALWVSKKVMGRRGCKCRGSGGGQETQVVMLGGTHGSTRHAVVPPHCAEFSSAASLLCGHAGE